MGLGFSREVCVNAGREAVGMGPSERRGIGEVHQYWPPGRSRGLEMATSGESGCRRASRVKNEPSSELSSHPDNHFLFSLLPSALLR